MICVRFVSIVLND